MCLRPLLYAGQSVVTAETVEIRLESLSLPTATSSFGVQQGLLRDPHILFFAEVRFRI